MPSAMEGELTQKVIWKNKIDFVREADKSDKKFTLEATAFFHWFVLLSHSLLHPLNQFVSSVGMLFQMTVGSFSSSILHFPTLLFILLIAPLPFSSEGLYCI